MEIGRILCVAVEERVEPRASTRCLSFGVSIFTYDT